MIHILHIYESSQGPTKHLRETANKASIQERYQKALELKQQQDDELGE